MKKIKDKLVVVHKGKFYVNLSFWEKLRFLLFGQVKGNHEKVSIEIKDGELI